MHNGTLFLSSHSRITAHSVRIVFCFSHQCSGIITYDVQRSCEYMYFVCDSVYNMLILQLAKDYDNIGFMRLAHYIVRSHQFWRLIAPILLWLLEFMLYWWSISIWNRITPLTIWFAFFHFLFERMLMYIFTLFASLFSNIFTCFFFLPLYQFEIYSLINNNRLHSEATTFYLWRKSWMKCWSLKNCCNWLMMINGNIFEFDAFLLLGLISVKVV